MAVRFDASGESFTRTLSLGTQTSFSLTMWVKLSVNRAAQTVFWQIDDNGVSPYLTVQALDGTAISLESNSWANASLSHTLTVGTWCFLGVGVSNDGTLNTAIGNANGTILDTTWARGAGTINANRLVLGTGGLASQYLNGCIAAVKVWSGVRLSKEELLQEARSYVPKRLADLRAWYPFLRTETVDYSGLAQTLSGGTGTSTEDGPPVQWGPGRRRRIAPAAVPVTGTLNAVLPALDATATATVSVSGSFARNLPALQAAAQATVKARGVLSATLPKLTASFTAEQPGGILNVVLPALQGSFAATASISGTLAGTLPALQASFTAFETIPDYDISLTVGPIVRAWNASQPGTSWTISTPAGGWTGSNPR